MNHTEQLQQIKNLSNQFVEMISTKIDALTNSLDYKNGSRFSYMQDRLNTYLKELNDFEIITESKRNEKPRAIKINQDYFIKTKPVENYMHVSV